MNIKKRVLAVTLSLALVVSALSLTPRAEIKTEASGSSIYVNVQLCSEDDSEDGYDERDTVGMCELANADSYGSALEFLEAAFTGVTLIKGVRDAEHLGSLSANEISCTTGIKRGDVYSTLAYDSSIPKSQAAPVTITEQFVYDGDVVADANAYKELGDNILDAVMEMYEAGSEVIPDEVNKPTELVYSDGDTEIRVGFHNAYAALMFREIYINPQAEIDGVEDADNIVSFSQDVVEISGQAITKKCTMQYNDLDAIIAAADENGSAATIAILAELPKELEIFPLTYTVTSTCKCQSKSWVTAKEATKEQEGRKDFVCDTCKTVYDTQSITKLPTTEDKKQTLDDVKLSTKSCTLYVGGTTGNTAKMKLDIPADVKSQIKSTTYKTSKSSIATVKNGKITANKKGTANITATITLNDGTNKSFVEKVTVKNASLSFKKKTVNVKKSKSISVTALANGYNPAKITWKTSNSKIAKITKKTKKGVVTIKGVKKGNATITATIKVSSKKSIKKTFKVKVK